MQIAYFGGSFDMFHIGHLKTIKEAHTFARDRNAKLVVGVNTDEVYLSHKGKEPIFTYDHRKEIIESLKFVDKVVAQDSLDTTGVLKREEADVYIICSDYSDSKDNERNYISSVDGEVIEIPYHNDAPSSTYIKSRIFNEITREDNNGKQLSQFS